MTDPSAAHLVTREPQHSAVVRQKVPMGELTSFFDRVFHLTLAAAAAQGRQVAGPPFAAYFSVPTDTIDVAAGFPVDAPVEPDGEVTPFVLPGGQAAELLHEGSYDLLGASYGQLHEWMGQQNLTPADFMWESYLNEPVPDAPEANRTMITWPVAQD